MQRRSIFLSTHPLRAMLEALLIGFVLLVILSVLSNLPFDIAVRPLPVPFLQIVFTFLVVPFCMFWFAARLKRFSLPRLQRYFLWLLLVTILSLILNYVGQELSRFLMTSAVAWQDNYAAIPRVVLVFAFDCAVFIICRIGVRMWLFWDHLRRTQLIWSLAHAIVILLALGAGVLILFIDGVIFYRLPAIYLLPMTMILVVVSLGVLVALIPPFALFSYLTMRGTVQRIKMLAAATGALRAGNYQVRVPVHGEDEVAQLQSDFNVMATELQRTLHELQEQRDNVAKLLNERRELIANVSHELRTPVATLRGYLETMLIHWEEVTPSDVHRDLRVMEDETVRLHGLVEDLFTLSRAEVGKLELQCAPTDIGELVQRVVDASAALAWRSSKIEVVAEISANLPSVLVDARRLEQILHNLLHNGVRHTSPGGIVAVMVTQEQSFVALHVKDTGEGIAAEDLPHIWKRFYQSKSSRMSGGTGLGLALVKEWTESMGGNVAVESIKGQGSCFTIYVPLVPLLESVTQPLLAYSNDRYHSLLNSPTMPLTRDFL